MKFLFMVLLVFVLNLFFLPEEVSGWWGRRRRRCVPPSVVGYHNWFDGFLNFKCPRGKALNYVHSTYSTCHKDRAFKFSCAPNVAVSSLRTRCSWTRNYVNDFDWPVTYRCPKHGFITGVQGVHQDKYEDRRFKFRCCRSRFYIPYHCKSSGYVNNWRSRFTFKVPKNHFIVGISSYHWDKKEDRRWHFTYCRAGYYRW